VSVCLSVRPSNHSPAAAAFGEFAAERRAGEKCRSTASGAGCPPAAAPQRGQQHGAQQQTRAVSRLQRTYEAVRRLVIAAPLLRHCAGDGRGFLSVIGAFITAAAAAASVAAAEIELIVPYPVRPSFTRYLVPVMGKTCG